MGTGTFGRVVECVDRKRGLNVAVKVVRSVKKYTESAKIEAEILDDIMDNGGAAGKRLVVQMYNHFVFDGHYCLVFEKLGMSLYDYLKAHDYAPYPLGHVREFARQLLETLDFLKNTMRLVHTDLKPENILLCSNDTVMQDGAEVPASTLVKVIDFGGATYDNDEHKSTVVNTRQYRGPEVILETDWSYPSDMWSAACIITELYTGDLLFATHNNREHLALIERCLGSFPEWLVKKSDVADKYFEKGTCRQTWRKELDEESQRHVRKQPRIEEIFAKDASSGIGELLKGMLELDPEKRLKPSEALRMPFFQEQGHAGRR